MQSLAILVMAILFALTHSAEAQFGSYCATAPGSRPVAVGGGYMCQCPDGSYASYGVACRAAPGPRKSQQQSAKPKSPEQTYCGTANDNMSYFCPAGARCSPGDIKMCSGADGKEQAAVARRLTAAQRQVAETQKKSSDQAAQKILEERDRLASIDKTAALSAAAGIVSSASQFVDLGKKASAAVPKSTNAGLKGWAVGDDKKGLQPDGRGYCTDYVRSIWPKITGKSLPAGLDHAGKWYENARKANLKTAPPEAIGHVPPGSIAVWDDGNFGHVAMVISNNGSALRVTEANWGSTYGPGAGKFERDNAITAQFNRHSEADLSYQQARSRSNGRYTLVGFILPE